MDKILDKTLESLDFYLSHLSDLKKEALRFIDITDNLELTIKPVDNGQPITDFTNEKVRKQNKRAAKIKAQFDNLCTPIWDFAADSTALLSFCPIFFSYLGLLAFLLSCLKSPTCLLPLYFCLETPTTLTSLLVPAPIPRSPVLFSLFCVLGPTALHLASTAL